MLPGERKEKFPQQLFRHGWKAATRLAHQRNLYVECPWSYKEGIGWKIARWSSGLCCKMTCKPYSGLPLGPVCLSSQCLSVVVYNVAGSLITSQTCLFIGCWVIIPLLSRLYCGCILGMTVVWTDPANSFQSARRWDLLGFSGCFFLAFVLL